MLPALEYACQLSAQLADGGGGALRAGPLHGSAALGGWVAERSDVDILFIAADDIRDDALRAMAGVRRSAGPHCPGRGLECSVVSASQAERPAPPWPFLLHAAASPDGMKVVWGRSHPGDPDLLMHYAVTRASGVPLAGPVAAQCIGPVPRSAILTYLAGEMAWAAANALESYVVLNACRALVFLREGRIGPEAREFAARVAAALRLAVSRSAGGPTPSPPA